jgi:hypothetical protein
MTAFAMAGVLAFVWAAALLVVAVLIRVQAKPSLLLARVEREMAALRSEVNGYRTAQAHLVTSLERRLKGLEQTTAIAANEVRMVSEQVMASLPAGPPVGKGEQAR